MKKVTSIPVFLFALFLAFFPYCYLCVFINPVADDFGFAVQSQHNDIFHLIKQTYLYWNGRYFSNIFIYLNPITWGSFVGYKFVSFLMIVLFVLGNFSFVNQLLYEQTKQTKILIAMLISLLYIHNMPIISEGFYWYTGTVIYLLGIIVGLFYTSLLIRVVRENKNGHLLLLLSLLLFIACGFNEVLSLLFVFFFMALTFIFYRNNLGKKRVIAFQLILSIIFLSAVIFSPGNEFREEAYQYAHNFSHSLIYSIMQVGRFTVSWVGSIPLIVVSVLYLSFNKRIREQNQLVKKSFFLQRWSSLLILFIITFICVFPAYWATGILGQHRTLNVAYFFFLIMWFVNLTVWYNYYQDKIGFKISNKRKIVLGVLLLTGIMFTGNGFNGLKDIFSGLANQYNQQMLTRFKQLNQAKNSTETVIMVEPITSSVRCLCVSDITQNPVDWINLAHTKYFKLDTKEITLQKK